MTWKRLSRKTEFTCPYYQIHHDRVVTHANQELDYYLVDVAPSVAIIAVTDTQEMLLIHQYRYPGQDYFLEAPGGSAEGGDLLDAAKRELQEEVGIAASAWEKLGSYYPYDGICSDECHVFLATGLSSALVDREASEEIEVQKVPIAHIQQMIREGKFRDGQTMAALALYFAFHDHL